MPRKQRERNRQNNQGLCSCQLCVWSQLRQGHQTQCMGGNPEVVQVVCCHPSLDRGDIYNGNGTVFWCEIPKLAYHKLVFLASLYSWAQDPGYFSSLRWHAQSHQHPWLVSLSPRQVLVTSPLALASKLSHIGKPESLSQRRSCAWPSGLIFENHISTFTQLKPILYKRQMRS